MKSYKFALVRKEFGFIDEIVKSLNQGNIGDPRFFSGIQVRPADEALMARTPTFDSWSSVAGGHHNYDSFFAVLKGVEGFQLHKLDEVGEAGSPGDTHVRAAENIGDQLFRLGVNPDFLVEVVQNDTDDYGRGEKSRFVTIYKMAGRYDLPGYHCRQIDKAAAELKAELFEA